jgi:hypothetical protein
MMRKIFFAMILITSLSGFAQEVENDSIYKTSEVDKLPEFSGGIANFSNLWQVNLWFKANENIKGKLLLNLLSKKIVNFQI